MRAADAAAGRQPLGDIQNLLPRFTASVPAAGTQLVDGQENLPPSLSAMSPLLPPRPRAAPPAGPQATQPGASLLQRLLQLRQPDGSQSDQPLVPPAMPWAAPAGSGQRRGRLSSLQAGVPAPPAAEPVQMISPQSELQSAQQCAAVLLYVILQTPGWLQRSTATPGLPCR